MIDSTVLIAHAYPKDDGHRQALTRLPPFTNGKKRHVTDYCILEVTNFLLRKASFKDALAALENLTKAGKVEVIYNDEVSFKATGEIFRKYPGLSFTDANMVLHMQRLGLKELLSFDGGFDKVREIKRVH